MSAGKGPPPEKAAERAAREKRLAEALRDNLKRRKAAAREAPAQPATTVPSGAKQPRS